MKTLSFGPNQQEVHLVLLELYMQVSALCVILEGILAEEGHAAPWASDIIKACDFRLVSAIRRADSNGHPVRDVTAR